MLLDKHWSYRTLNVWNKISFHFVLMAPLEKLKKSRQLDKLLASLKFEKKILFAILELA